MSQLNQDDLLGRYVSLLLEWNAAMQLTSRQSGPDDIWRHIKDCQLMLPFVRGHHIADLGSGSGMPGLIWAILRPDKHVTLFEKQQKRVAFLRYAISSCNLAERVTVVHGDWHQMKPLQRFDTITARAVTAMPGWALSVIDWLTDVGCCLGWYHEPNLPYTLVWPPALILTQVVYAGQIAPNQNRFAAIVEPRVSDQRWGKESAYHRGSQSKGRGR